MGVYIIALEKPSPPTCSLVHITGLLFLIHRAGCIWNLQWIFVLICSHKWSYGIDPKRKYASNGFFPFLVNAF